MPSKQAQRRVDQREGRLGAAPLHRGLVVFAAAVVVTGATAAGQAAAHPLLTCTPPANVTTSTPIGCTVTMVDNVTGKTQETDTSTLLITSSTGGKIHVPSIVLKAADKGTHSFQVTFQTASASEVLEVTLGASGPGFYLAAPLNVRDSRGSPVTAQAPGTTDPTFLSVSCAPSGMQATCTLRAFDAKNGALATGYAGTVTLNDPADLDAVLVNGYQFQPGDQGTHSFSVVASSAGLTEMVVANDGTSQSYSAPWVAAAEGNLVLDGPLYRILGGMDVSGTASAQPAARLFLDAGAIVPLTGTNVATSLFNVWGEARVASMPQNSATAAGVFGQTNVVAPLSSADMRVLAENLAGEAGLEWAFNHRNRPETGQGVFGLIGTAGISTPITQDQLGAIPVYALGPQVSSSGSAPTCTASNLQSELVNAGIISSSVASTCPNIAFVSQTRNLMFLEYGGGFRLLWFSQVALYPGQVDLTVGQNEAISGGRLHGLVLHPSFSLPIKANTGRLGFYLYGEAYLHVARPVVANSIILPAPSGTMLSIASAVTQIPVAPPNADYIRIGIGFDLGALIKGHP